MTRIVAVAIILEDEESIPELLRHLAERIEARPLQCAGYCDSLIIKDINGHTIGHLSVSE